MSRPSRNPTSKWLYASAIAFPLLILIVLAGFARNTVASLEKSRQTVDRTLVLKRELALLLRIVVDAETGQRGFVLGKREEFLEPYTYALANIPIVESRIEEIIIDSVARDLFGKLKTTIDTRMGFSAEVIRLQRNGEHDRTVELVATGKGRELMNAVRAASDKLDARQDELLAERQDQLRKTAKLHENITWLLILLDVCFIAFVAWLLLKLRSAESLLRVCAWSQTVEYEGEWLTYEEYLRRRFGLQITHGISPAEAEKFFPKKSTPPSSAAA